MKQKNNQKAKFNNYSNNRDDYSNNHSNNRDDYKVEINSLILNYFILFYNYYDC